MVIKGILNRLSYYKLLARMTYSPSFAYKTANDYWITATKTHTDMDWKEFEFYYEKIKQIMLPTKDDRILDAGCGSGELSHLFFNNGYNIMGFDPSPYLISQAQTKFESKNFYIDDFIKMSNTNGKFTKILINNAFFYVHSKHYQIVFRNLSKFLADNGTLFLLDNPDYSKRQILFKTYNNSRSRKILSFFFPVYDSAKAGFWIKFNHIQKIALKNDLVLMNKSDSWSNYRSHFIFTKHKKGDST